MTEQITLEDLFALTVRTIRADGETAAQEHLARITEACGTTVDQEIARFRLAAAGDRDAEAELLEDLQAMGALMQFNPAPAAEYDFSIPEKQRETSGLDLAAAPDPSDLRYLFG